MKIALPTPCINTLLLEMDYTLMELHDAMKAQDDLLAFECKDKLETIRLRLIVHGYFKH